MFPSPLERKTEHVGFRGGCRHYFRTIHGKVHGIFTALCVAVLGSLQGHIIFTAVPIFNISAEFPIGLDSSRLRRTQNALHTTCSAVNG